MLSGSPVAATAISLFGAGTLTKLQTFTMLSGSRLGASFIVLLTGFLYALRNRDRERGRVDRHRASRRMTMTAIVYLPGMLIGYAIIRAGLLDGFELARVGQARRASSARSGVRSWTSSSARVPGWALFLVGLGVILVSFSLIDRVLPARRAATRRPRSARRGSSSRGRCSLLGCLVATLTLSVSVALTVLVPLAAKGLVKRDEALPYIMGANITTLADTLVVAMLQPTPVAAQIVLAEAIGVTIVSLVILAFVVPAGEAVRDRPGRLARRVEPPAGAVRGHRCSCCP